MNSPGRNARVSLRAAATAKEEASPPSPSTRGSAWSASSRAEQVAPKNLGAQTHAPVSASHAPRPGPPHAGEPPGHAAAALGSVLECAKEGVPDDEEAVPALAQCLEDSGRSVRIAAAEALGKCGAKMPLNF